MFAAPGSQVSVLSRWDGLAMSALRDQGNPDERIVEQRLIFFGTRVLPQKARFLCDGCGGSFQIHYW